ncbi:HEAT repeat [Thiothrix eikelboomii]|uniref:HEAT repeat n=1 Tax=Thiothrix eikelboomii TaxID=92487 RepID=A0A1T4W2L5_9GAMM|nr:HEAT repeat domain-containing protein [Thiothrix eikelboomii]SKA71437.1 HEAT repeat [Thiothrix eikelboomii]
MNIEASPYPGLRPYREDEYHKFFGRQADAEILIDKLLTNRLTLLFAASGVGKSSLLQAAIIPKLKAAEGENLSVAYHNDWISPPTQSVKLAVLNALQASKIIAADTDFSDDTLPEILSFSSALVRPPFVLILDQFEEFFRYQRAGSEFQIFIDQLITLITAPPLALSLVISMREDFALELNAFKPKLPTILFENFYRLEKLGRDTALMAIEAPVKQLGFRYEPELLKALTHDLLSRELDLNPNLPVAELRMTVEPPYLQIVCAHVWELNKNNPDKSLHLASYIKAGRAQGILKSYIEHTLDSFSHKEKRLAAQAFDLLVNQRGVKMAYTVPALAKTLKVKNSELQAVLEKLEKVRVLRKQQRAEETWYELYHDMFSTSLETWNSAWKNKIRSRRDLKILLGSLLGICLIIAGIDVYVNSQFYHLRLSAKQYSDRIELWQGMTDNSLWPFDLFRQRQYLAETHLTRDDLEPDKRFSQKNIYRDHDLQTPLIINRPIEERITGLAENGDYLAAVQLAQDTITPNNIELAKRVIPHLNAINTETAAQAVYSLLKESSSKTIKNTLADEATQGRNGIILLRHGLDSLQLPESSTNHSSKAEFIFWQNQLSFQATRLDVLDKWLNWKVTDLEKLLSTPYTEKISIYLDDLIKNHDSFNEAAIEIAVSLNTPNIKSYLLNSLATEKNPSTRISIISNLAKLKAEEASSELIDSIIDETINEIINELNNGNLETITTAIKAIKSLPNQKTTPFLIKLLKNEDSKTRNTAAYTLNLLKNQTTIPEFVKLLNDKNLEIRSIAMYALGSLKAQTAIPDLMQLLKDENPSIRSEAIQALGSLKAQAAISELIKLLKDKDDDVRYLAIRTLGLLQAQASSSELILLLKDENSTIRSAAIYALSQLKNKTPLSETINLLKDESEQVRSAAIYALSQLKNQAAIPELRNLLKDENEQVRGTAIQALSFLKAQATTPDFIVLLKDDEANIRKQATLALSSLPTKTAIPALIKLLKDEDEEVRNAAIKTLDSLQAQITIPELIKLKKHSKYVQTNNLLYKENPSITSNINYILNLSTLEQMDKEHKNQYLINKYISQEQLYFLLQKLKQNKVSPTLIALSLEKNTNSLNQTQKNLISKALSLVDRTVLAEAKAELAQLEQLEAHTQAKQNTLWPLLSAAELKTKIAENKTKITNWRYQRDLPPPDPSHQLTTAELKQQEQEQDDYEYARILAYEYSFDLALLDEATALQFLHDDLYEVREAVARGLANSPFLGVGLLKKLEKTWLTTDDPIERQAVFHALDLCLLALEHTGTAKELAELQAYLAALKAYPTSDDNKDHPAKLAILPRMDWTVTLLNWRIEAQKELKTATEERFPALLQAYCLNPDGSDLPKEACKNPSILSLYEQE